MLSMLPSSKLLNDRELLLLVCLLINHLTVRALTKALMLHRTEDSTLVSLSADDCMCLFRCDNGDACRCNLLHQGQCQSTLAVIQRSHCSQAQNDNDWPCNLRLQYVLFVLLS